MQRNSDLEQNYRLGRDGLMVSRDNKSIFFVSLPKSGTVYTWYSLRDMTGLAMPEFHLMEGWESYNAGRDFSCPEIYACGDYSTQLLRPEQMKPFLRGYIFGAHMQASYHNMTVLNESGIDRITVLLRDPRDAFVSWVHHLRHLGRAARNYHSKIYHMPRAYFDWTLTEQFDFQVRTFLPTTINWIEGWLDYYASSDKKVDILFVYYDELKRDPESYIRKIVEFHEVEDVDFSRLIVPEQGKMHFRKGEHEQWKIDFSSANQELAADLLQDRIIRGFAQAADAHRGVAASEREFAAGNWIAAANAALEVVEQFSSCFRGYELLLQSASAAGQNIREFEAEVRQVLSALTLGDLFRYQDVLVPKARNLYKQVAGPR